MKSVSSFSSIDILLIAVSTRGRAPQAFFQRNTPSDSDWTRWGLL